MLMMPAAALPYQNSFWVNEAGEKRYGVRDGRELLLVWRCGSSAGQDWLAAFYQEKILRSSSEISANRSAPLLVRS